MEPESSSPCSVEPAIGTCPEPVESILHSVFARHVHVGPRCCHFASVRLALLQQAPHCKGPTTCGISIRAYAPEMRFEPPDEFREMVSEMFCQLWFLSGGRPNCWGGSGVAHS
jgi:hypothetical protein